MEKYVYKANNKSNGEIRGEERASNPAECDKSAPLGSFSLGGSSPLTGYFGAGKLPSPLIGCYGQSQKKVKETPKFSTMEEAQAIIQSLIDNLEEEREESEKLLMDKYEEAYEIIKEERKKFAEKLAEKENIEVKLYEEFNNQTRAMKEFMVSKLDSFIKLWLDIFKDKEDDDAMEMLAEFRKKYSPDDLFELAMAHEKKSLIGKPHVVELGLSFEMLERAMNLPPGVKLVAVREGDFHESVKLRFVTNEELSHSVATDDLHKVGDMFRDPEAHRAPDHGATRG